MRVRMFFLLFISAIFITSCDKADTLEPTEPSTLNNALGKATNARIFSTITITSDTPHGPITSTDYVCSGSGGNCLSEVVIEGATLGTGYEEFLSSLENGYLAAFSQTTSFTSLFPNILSYPEILKGLQKGQLIITRFNSSVTDYSYFVIHDAGLQVNESNADEVGKLVLPVLHR